MFSGTVNYPLENLSKENRWVKLADALDWKHIESEYNKRPGHPSGEINIEGKGVHPLRSIHLFSWILHDNRGDCTQLHLAIQ